MKALINKLIACKPNKEFARDHERFIAEVNWRRTWNAN